jgi:acid phosphatase
VIVLENEPYSNVVGNLSSAPYQNQLIRQYALASNYFAVTHPSLPNYLALTGGSTFGIASNCKPVICIINAQNVGDLFVAAGLTWKSYVESYPGSCATSVVHDASLLYDRAHNPFLHYKDVNSNYAYCTSHVVAFENLSAGFMADLSAHILPSYSFIVPNVCHDGEEANATKCGSINNLKNADQWLSGFLPNVLIAPEFSSTIIFVVYDEGNVLSNQVSSVVISP